MSKLAIHIENIAEKYNIKAISRREQLDVLVVTKDQPVIILVDLTKYPIVKNVIKNNPNIVFGQPTNIEIKALQNSPEYQSGVTIIEDTNIKGVHILPSKSSNVLLKKQIARLQKINPFLYSSEYVKLEINDNVILDRIISFVSKNNMRSSRRVRIPLPSPILTSHKKTLDDTFQSTIDIANDAIQEAYQTAKTMEFGIIKMNGNELIEEHSDGSKTILKTFPNRPRIETRTLILK